MTPQIVIGIIGLINVWMIYAMKRANMRYDEHCQEHKELIKRLIELEKTALAEEKFRQIIREELDRFELRLMNENRIPPKTKRS